MNRQFSFRGFEIGDPELFVNLKLISKTFSSASVPILMRGWFAGFEQCCDGRSFFVCGLAPSYRLTSNQSCSFKYLEEKDSFACMD